MIILFVITMLSLGVAVVMSVIAWRLGREEQRRSDARVEALAAEIRTEKGDGSQTPVTFFIASRPTNLVRTFAIGALVVGTLATVVLVLTSSRQPVSTATLPATPTSPAAVAPLELVALGHEREGDRLTVRGVVRNPAGTAEVEQLAAVVFVFNRDGRFVTSARAPIERGTLASGVESTFVVMVTGVDDVGRYRVSFRSDDRIVAHVDRRDRAATAQLQ